MRIAFEAPEELALADIEQKLQSVVSRFAMTLAVTEADAVSKIILMVSKFDHAMLHLLYQIRVGWLRAEVVAIVSNHPDSEQTAQKENIPFHYWPVTKETRSHRRCA